MITTQHGSPEISRTSVALPIRSVDDLLRLAHDECEALYRDARVPAIEEVSGNLVGRMLVSPIVSQPIADVVRGIARASWFPWKGKTFAPKNAKEWDYTFRLEPGQKVYFFVAAFNQFGTSDAVRTNDIVLTGP